MTLGLGSYSYHHCFALAGQPEVPARFDILDAIGHAAQRGLKAAHIDAYHVGSLDEAHLACLRDAAGERSVALQLGFMGTDLDTLGPWLRAAATLGSPVLRTFVSRNRYVPPVQEQVRQAVANLRETMKLAEDLNVKIAVENHMELRSEELLQIAASVPSTNLGFCFDTCNPLPALEDPPGGGPEPRAVCGHGAPQGCHDHARRRHGHLPRRAAGRVNRPLA